MFALCIESSHERGMGHLFRCFSIIDYLKKNNQQFIVLINEDTSSDNLLMEKKIPYEIVNYNDLQSNWETLIINKYNINVWINDKFETSQQLCQHVKENNILLVAIDDRGMGTELADLHFAGMMNAVYEKIRGKKIYTGKDYTILNPEIDIYKRARTKLQKVVVTLGGSDTYGVTLKVLKILKKYNIPADIITGPGFLNKIELINEIDDRYRIIGQVPSLIQEFSKYDLAITGGGVTCLETSASGLPSIIIANEKHEIYTGEYVASYGSALFAGHHDNINGELFTLPLDISRMSLSGLDNFNTNGIFNMFKIIDSCRMKGFNHGEYKG